MHFSHCFIQNWDEIESFKNEKSHGVLFFHFRMNPGADPDEMLHYFVKVFAVCHSTGRAATFTKFGKRLHEFQE